MSVITMFSGSFCGQDAIMDAVVAATGFARISDRDITRQAAKRSGLDEDKICRAFSARTSVFNKFTHEKERSVAHVKLVLAEMLHEDNLLFSGFSARAVPSEITHVLRVCLIADLPSRLAAASKEKGLDKKQALKVIRSYDEDCAAWVRAVSGAADPWDAALYDIVIPTDKLDVKAAVELIQNNLKKDVLAPTEGSRQAARDFLLAAKTEATLVKEGHDVGVFAQNGAVTLTINKHVLMLSRLEEELRAVAEKVPGIESLHIKVGEEFYQADIYRKYNFEMPARVLLVDDEREFVQTLSERLLMRDMGSAVAYDGESALNLIKEDEPEVMILDLKMPGIDGIEVLKRVKQTNPDIEVIILTGHGSDVDRRTCMKLGAFAYLQKPVDIDLLSDTLKQANEKIQKKNQAGPL